MSLQQIKIHGEVKVFYFDYSGVAKGEGGEGHMLWVPRWGLGGGAEIDLI